MPRRWARYAAVGLAGYEVPWYVTMRWGFIRGGCLGPRGRVCEDTLSFQLELAASGPVSCYQCRWIQWVWKSLAVLYDIGSCIIHSPSTTESEMCRGERSLSGCLRLSQVASRMSFLQSPVCSVRTGHTNTSLSLLYVSTLPSFVIPGNKVLIGASESCKDTITNPLNHPELHLPFNQQKLSRSPCPQFEIQTTPKVMTQHPRPPFDRTLEHPARLQTCLPADAVPSLRFNTEIA